jgi:sulfite oxidase
MEKMLIGNLHPSDQGKVDEIMDKISEERDPYENEPTRSPFLKVHNDAPMNAEVPADLLNSQYITPVSEFYIRHHHPVPLLSEKQVEDFRLDVDLSLLSGMKQIAKLSLAQIKSLPKVEVTSTLQCSGNRRSGFNNLRETSGTPWSQGAISTAKWGGARLVDVLMLASEQLTDDVTSHGPEEGTYCATKSHSIGSLPQTLQSVRRLLDLHPNLQHIRFESLDGMSSSVDVGKALSPFGDVIIAYEMNGEELNREHGYPLRVIVPGYAAVRSPKWVSRLELAEEEAEGVWHRGLNYKILPPSVINASKVDLEQMPGLSEVSVFSGITKVSRVVESSGDAVKRMVPGETVLVKASGWAWAGEYFVFSVVVLRNLTHSLNSIELT